jgi:Fe-S-cluster containining protein
MSTEPDGECVSYDLRLTVLGEELRGRVSLPTSAIRVADLLPVLHSLADALVAASTRLVEAQGNAISCRAGCAACCREPVPIAQAEAVHLAELAASMPGERRDAIRGRSEAAIQRLEREAMLAEVARRMESGQPDVGSELAVAYLERQIACPFLEDEMCSIYEHRPAACREHVVTSPPSHCGEPAREIERVFLPARVSPVLFRLGDGLGRDLARAVPLVMAIAWAERHGDEASKRFPGPRLFESFLREFSRTQLGREMPGERGGRPGGEVRFSP